MRIRRFPEGSWIASKTFEIIISVFFEKTFQPSWVSFGGKKLKVGKGQKREKRNVSSGEESWFWFIDPGVCGQYRTKHYWSVQQGFGMELLFLGHFYKTKVVLKFLEITGPELNDSLLICLFLSKLFREKIYQLKVLSKFDCLFKRDFFLQKIWSHKIDSGE